MEIKKSSRTPAPCVDGLHLQKKSSCDGEHKMCYQVKQRHRYTYGLLPSKY